MLVATDDTGPFSFTITMTELTRNQKREARRAAKWLLGFINDIDWGEKRYDEDKEAWFPKHVNTNEITVQRLERAPCVWTKSLSQKRILDHFSEIGTFYFTGARGDLTLLMLDIDCHKFGTLEGAIRFAQYLRENYFPGLYFEISTNGNGIHGYLLVDKTGITAPEYNDAAKALDKWLKGCLAVTTFDVETVETKGLCPVVEWSNARGKVAHYTAGTLAKLPRNWKQFDRWKKTTRLTVQQIKDLMAGHPVPLPVKHLKISSGGGSVLGKHIDPDRIKELIPIGDSILQQAKVHISASYRSVVVAEDIAIFTALLEFFHKHPNRDGTLPWARFSSLWEAVYQAEDCGRAFDNKRFAYIRDLFTNLGLIEWIDNTFVVGDPILGVKGRAAKWTASGKLLRLLELFGSSLLTVSGSILTGNMDFEAFLHEQFDGKMNGIRPIQTFLKAFNWWEHVEKVDRVIAQAA